MRDMLGAAIIETYPMAVANAALFALTLVLPLLLVGYARQATRRVSADFSLRRLEAFELDRAEAQYRKICQRMGEIDKLARGGTGSLWQRLKHRIKIGEQYDVELEDLRASARHLRASIILFRRRPIQRLRAWVHVISSRFAFGGSLASYLTILVPATVFIYFSEQPLWAQDLASTLETAMLWRPFDERLLYVNAITSAFVLALMPLLYTMRRAKLYSDHRLQTKALRDFAGADPDKLIDDAPSTAQLEDPLSFDLIDGDGWCAILGLPPTATADEVREAYKAKVRQSHPDRVHGLAPAFRELAEAETKKLNAAYEEALLAVNGGQEPRAKVSG
ncbi:MAG: DnaJ domain-containing protein [Rhizobiales bacterium]|nr:DnaJ domain-containing protein [Hyphomicrobiales bacterium]